MENNGKDSIKALKKQLKLYKRRYEDTLRDLKITEQMRNHYDRFYRSNMDKLTALNEKLEQIAWFDSLTGLPNRKNFDNYLAQKLSEADRASCRGALFFIDLDGFKDINDTYGHTTGDNLLIVITSRLKEVLRKNELLARLGGDEFVVVIANMDDPSQVTRIAARIIEVCQQPIKVDHKILTVSASVGIALYPDDIDPDSDQDQATQLQQFADLAMYRAKHLGKNRYCFYHFEMAQKASMDLKLRANIRQALKLRTFKPFYQPLFSRSEGKIIGLEVLARWPQHNGSSLTPENFLPMMEKLNLLPELDFLMLEIALDFLQRNPVFRRDLHYVSVNFSVETFSAVNCLERFLDLLERYSTIPSHLLVLEITENSFFNESSDGLQAMAKLHQIGVRLALDDFGTGYSALSYLDRVPIDIIKIDQYFVKRLPDDAFSRTIVSHIISMSKQLGFELVAEGIENKAQFEYFYRTQCDILQGYYISQPLAEDALFAENLLLGELGTLVPTTNAEPNRLADPSRSAKR